MAPNGGEIHRLLLNCLLMRRAMLSRRTGDNMRRILTAK